jgi:phytoene synthase
VLDETYRRRALPPGSVRYYSWLFAGGEARGALLGIYALLAEWRVLCSPGIDPTVAATKLAWWREEIGRLASGRPVHPISRWLAALPRAAAADFAPLTSAVDAALVEAGGVPVERGAELEAHANALQGEALLIAARLSEPEPDVAALGACTRALAAADYLGAALGGYAEAARHGRVVFAVDELLAAGIEGADLEAGTPTPALRAYLDELGSRADQHYRRAAEFLPQRSRARQRGLLVLAELGRRRLSSRMPAALPARGIGDLLHAWRAARSAR